jgi:hypothetical protein
MRSLRRPRSLSNVRTPIAVSCIPLASRLSPTIPAGARRILVAVDTLANGVRWRDDGTNPTATVGTPLGTGTVGAGPQVLEYEASGTALKFIRSAAADALLNLTYYA